MEQFRGKRVEKEASPFGVLRVLRNRMARLFFCGGLPFLTACQEPSQTLVEAGIIAPEYSSSHRPLPICFFNDLTEVCRNELRQNVVLNPTCKEDKKAHEDQKDKDDEKEDKDKKNEKPSCEPEDISIYEIPFSSGVEMEWGVNKIPPEHVLVHDLSDCFVIEEGDLFSLTLFVDGAKARCSGNRCRNKDWVLSLDLLTAFRLKTYEELSTGGCDLTDSIISEQLATDPEVFIELKTETPQLPVISRQ